MRLHQLQLRAFGPFGGAETINFDSLGAHGLFLMHGPTGSGKTSVLDAICFALYAGVPGVRGSQAERLVSDHAQPGVTPMVKLDFTVSGRRLRITRTPSYLASKKRGSGQTRRQASVVLEEHRDGSWSVLSTRADETAEVLDELIGLGLRQFAQVVLLPQGEFASFLQAKADHRTALLQKLFDISRFSDLENWLQESRKLTREEVAAADRSIAMAVIRAEESLVEFATTLQGWQSLPVTVLPEQIRLLQRKVSDLLTESMARADSAATAHESAQRAHEQAVLLDGQQQQARAATATWAQWEAGAEHFAESMNRLDAHARAQRVEPVRRTLRRITDQLNRAQSDFETLSATAPAALRDNPDLADISRRTDEGGHIVRQAAITRHSLERARRELPPLTIAIARLSKERESVTTQFAALDQRVQVLADALEAAQVTAETEPAIGQQEQLLAEWTNSQRAERDAHLQLTRAEDVVNRAREQFMSAERAVLDLRARRLSGIAAELAQPLQPGDPCPVCGSPEHPDLAQSADPVTAEDIERAEERAASAGDALSTAEQGLAACGATHTVATQAVATTQDRWSALFASDLDDATAPAHRERVAASRAEIDRAKSTIAAARAEIEQLQRERETLRSKEHDIVARAARAQTEHDALEEQLQTLDADLDRQVQDHHQVCPCVAGAEMTRGPDLPQEKHREFGELLVRYTDAYRALSGLTQQHSETTAELDRQAEVEGFSSAAEAHSALMQSTSAAALQREVDQARQSAERARGVLDEPSIKRALAQDPVDLTAVQQARQHAATAAKAARDDFDALQRAGRSLDRLLTDVERVLQSSADDRQRLPVLNRLADVTSGAADNALRMRLSAYVLAARLEEVTTLANQQLATMSAGRYRLEHTDAVAKGGVRSGLGLRVHDSWTGTSRDTSTLSGGESFMVSLCLALGLGQAVLHDSGGRPLQTLLVDEGFGSLDDESLELVMQVLDDLRAGGRTVGIVSHVSELRTRVPAQIRVHKTEQGSSVQVHVGDASSAA